MQLPFFGAKKAHACELLVDLGSGSLAMAVLCGSSDTHKTHILASRRQSLALTEQEMEASIVFDKILKLIQPTHDELIKLLPEDHRHPYTRVTVLLRAPWFSAQSADAAEDFHEQIHITQAHIDTLAKKATSSVTGLTGDVFEQVVVRTELNGYPTGVPVGKEAHRAHVITLSSAMESGREASVRAALSPLAPKLTVEIRSAAHVAIRVLNPLARRTPHYVVIDITSEASSIMVVSSNRITAYETVSTGWRALVREVARKYSTTPEEALSRLRMVIAEACTGDDCANVFNALSDLAPSFIKGYVDTFTKLTADEKLPSTLVLIAPHDVAPWFIELLGRIDFAPFTHTGRPFFVRRFHEQHAAAMVEFSTAAVSDAGVAFGAAFVHMRGQ